MYPVPEKNYGKKKTQTFDNKPLNSDGGGFTLQHRGGIFSTAGDNYHLFTMFYNKNHY